MTALDAAGKLDVRALGVILADCGDRIFEYFRPSTVARWLTGERRPSRANILCLNRLYEAAEIAASIERKG